MVEGNRFITRCGTRGCKGVGQEGRYESRKEREREKERRGDRTRFRAARTTSWMLLACLSLSFPLFFAYAHTLYIIRLPAPCPPFHVQLGPFYFAARSTWTGRSRDTPPYFPSYVSPTYRGKPYRTMYRSLLFSLSLLLSLHLFCIVSSTQESRALRHSGSPYSTIDRSRVIDTDRATNGALLEVEFNE